MAPTMEPTMTKEQMMQIIVDLRADFERLEAVIVAKDEEIATLRAQVTEAWRGHLSRSVAGALEESAAHRRSLVTGRCVP